MGISERDRMRNEEGNVDGNTVCTHLVDQFINNSSLDL